MKLQNNKEDVFIKSISSDDAIFHYTRRSTALEKILFDDCFKFSNFKNSNDPHEYKNKRFVVGGWSLGDGIDQQAHHIIEALDKFLEENVSFISFCSNTIKNNSLKSHGCLKSRMWSQYGDNHEGICLALSKEKLENLIRENIKEDQYIMYQDAMSYKEDVNANSGHNFPRINHDTFKKKPMDVAINHIKKYQKEMLFCKQLDYEDEQEYRIVVLQKDNVSNYMVVPEIQVSKCLIGVILGDRFPQVYKPTIDKLSESMDFPYRKLHWESGKYF